MAAHLESRHNRFVDFEYERLASDNAARAKKSLAGRG
jgi:hypothetical protein